MGRVNREIREIREKNADAKKCEWESKSFAARKL